METTKSTTDAMEATASTTPNTTTATTIAPQVVRNDEYINTFYDIANKLDTNPSFPDDDKLFSKIIELSSKTKQTKKLSPQFISKYFKRFPTLQEKAIDCLIDLFDSSDDDVLMRVNALKAIPTICRDNPDHIAKLVDILSQLLNTDSKVEAEHTKNSLVELYKLNSVTTLNSFLTFLESEESSMEDQSTSTSTPTTLLSFLKDSIIPLVRTEYSKSSLETQTFFRARVLKLIAKCTSTTELDLLFQLLECFTQYKVQETITDLETNVLPVIESQSLDIIRKKLINFTKMLLFKSKKPHTDINCNKLFDIYLNKIIPKINELDETNKTELVSVFSQITPHMTQEVSIQFLEPVYNLFKATVPSKTTTPVADVDLEFTIVEALLYALSSIGSKSTSSLCKLCGFKLVTGQPSDMNADPVKYEDFLGRHRFLDEKCRETLGKANKAIPNLGNPKDKAQLKLAQKTLLSTQNILTIMQNLLKSPPVTNINNLVISSTIFKGKQNTIHNVSPVFKPQQIQPRQYQQSSQKQYQKHQSQQQTYQQHVPLQRNQQQKSNRYQPYVTPGRRHQDLDKPKQDGNGVEVQYFTEKYNKPSSFKGRGPKSY
ncbi:hypothetical protein RB653_003772 [Dictyostelium firmibasis]|uniref:Apoptosis inhibitor 5 n=1 Tax=Dictyostelium firmibasis TaxID=79012 RepID=A0AAN7TYB6_9MYCE